jgi:hypothetical protein
VTAGAFRWSANLGAHTGTKYLLIYQWQPERIIHYHGHDNGGLHGTPLVSYRCGNTKSIEEPHFGDIGYQWTDNFESGWTTAETFR